MKNVLKLSEADLKTGQKTSWHDQYRNSAWIFVGGLPYDLSEGDIICVFSQFGEIVNINLVRDKATGKQKGFCFICYEDQRSTVLAVDNLNGVKVWKRTNERTNQSIFECFCNLQILGKSMRVDHVNDYKPPKEHDDMDDVTRQLQSEGCAPRAQLRPEDIKREHDKAIKLESDDAKDAVDGTIVGGVRLPQRLPIGNSRESQKRPPVAESSSDRDSDRKKMVSQRLMFNNRTTVIHICFSLCHCRKYRRNRKNRKNRKIETLSQLK